MSNLTFELLAFGGVFAQVQKGDAEHWSARELRSGGGGGGGGSGGGSAGGHGGGSGGEAWRCFDCEGPVDKMVFQWTYDKLTPVREWYNCCLYKEPGRT